jgi:uncharacterized cupredoxin-like copper-binding protein
VDNRLSAAAHLIAAFGACIVLAAAVSGCGSAFGGSVGSVGSVGQVVRVNERDFEIAASPKQVSAGTVTFESENHGPDAHELIVVRLHGAPLPFRSDGMTVSEEALKGAIVGALEPGAPGSMRRLEVHLGRGRYVLLCNMSGHYMGGMHTVVVVR